MTASLRLRSSSVWLVIVVAALCCSPAGATYYAPATGIEASCYIYWGSPTQYLYCGGTSSVRNICVGDTVSFTFRGGQATPWNIDDLDTSNDPNPLQDQLDCYIDFGDNSSGHDWGPYRYQTPHSPPTASHQYTTAGEYTVHWSASDVAEYDSQYRSGADDGNLAGSAIIRVWDPNSPVLDRGLPTTCINDGTNHCRSNIKWADSNPNIVYGDKLALPSGSWTIDKIRVWVIPSVPGYSSYSLSDYFSSVALYWELEYGGSGLAAVEPGTFTTGNQTDNGDIDITASSYAGGLDYLRPDGGYDKVWQIDFSNLAWNVYGSAPYVFGVHGVPRVDRLWFNAASYGMSSGDGHVRRFDVTHLSQGSTVIDPSGWFDGKGSDINVQVFAHPR